MKLLYKLATSSYHLLLEGLSPVNQKARKWVDGRKDLQSQLSTIQVNQPLIWFHCASLGEFEQGKPVMEAYKKRHPEWLLLVTFFSPSGYDARKNYEIADYVTYLPKENVKNIDLFLNVFKPKIAVFIKYEFWYGYMSALEEKKIPLIFISSSFRKSQVFFKLYGGWFLKQLKPVLRFFVQDQKSKELLYNYGVHQVEVSGDTRFDRVLDTKNSDEDIREVEQFKANSKLLIFGSAWDVETEFALKITDNLPADWKLIYAPHEIDSSKIEKLCKEWGQECVQFSTSNELERMKAKILIIDTIGHLARSYKYADIAFVGGGFIDGIHNILEPLAFGVPVFFGPNHKDFWEAQDAITNGIGFEVSDFETFENEFLKLANNPERLKRNTAQSKLFVYERSGATKVVVEFLNKIGQIISCQI